MKQHLDHIRVHIGMIPWQAIRSIAGMGEGSPLWHDGAWWLHELLAAIPKGEQWTTRELLASLGAFNAKDGKALVQALWRFRTSPAFAGHWSRDPSRLHMGNPLILWHRPQAPGEPTEHRPQAPGEPTEHRSQAPGEPTEHRTKEEDSK